MSGRAARDGAKRPPTPTNGRPRHERRVVVWLDRVVTDDGVPGLLTDSSAVGLDDLTDDEAEALASEHEQAARRLRAGWRGGPRIVH